MKQNYFIYNNNRYYAGTTIILSIFDIYSRRVCNVKAKFLWYNDTSKKYGVEIYGKECIYEEDSFNNNFIEIYEHNKTKTQAPISHKEYKFTDELNIDYMLIAWIWYIFIMLVAVIFYARIEIWILASVVFFNYRNKKLKEAGYK